MACKTLHERPHAALLVLGVGNLEIRLSHPIANSGDDFVVHQGVQQLAA